MIELEKTYLAKSLPKGLAKCKQKLILDIYIPSTSRHPNLRIRRSSYKCELTKKQPVKDDPSHQREQTVPLTEQEFCALSRVPGKRVQKVRYYYPYHGKTAEIDVFQGRLKGLVLVDFEFRTKKEKDLFMMPDFCLKEITEEEFIAGGMLCGKSYKDIEPQLKKHGYRKLFLPSR